MGKKTICKDCSRNLQKCTCTDDTIDMKQELEIIKCYFIPNNNTSSSTICGNCGKEKMLHTIDSGIKTYESVITQEEPKQETFKEAAFENSVDYKPFEDNLKPQKYYEYGFIKGAKWHEKQNKNIYNEADMREAYFTAIRSTGEGWNGEYANGNCPNIEKTFNDGFEIFIEQYKKK